MALRGVRAHDGHCSPTARTIESPIPIPAQPHNDYLHPQRVAFRDSDYSEADLGARRFVDCTFERCNLTSAEWRGVSLNNVTFVGCKLLGGNLTGVRKTLLAVAFEDCRLDYVDFGGLDLATTRFVRCSLLDATFVGTDLSGATFEGCDLSGALFRNTNLSGADLRGADGLVLDPGEPHPESQGLGLRPRRLRALRKTTRRSLRKPGTKETRKVPLFSWVPPLLISLEGRPIDRLICGGPSVTKLDIE